MINLCCLCRRAISPSRQPIVQRPLLFHFGMQSGLSVSSELRALAYSISACRAASHRSALENSWVEITAPFATPSQLTMIRTWVTITSSPGRWPADDPTAHGLSHLALLWQNLAIDRRYWIPESGFQ